MTNTESTTTLSNVDITSAEDSEFFLRCTGNNNQCGWGTTGKNGADCLFTAVDQTMEGDIIWDSISQLDFYMTDGSTLTGTVTGSDGTVYVQGTGQYTITVESYDTDGDVSGTSDTSEWSSYEAERPDGL